ncbi:MAG: hypothetical protein ABFS86_18650 [Planctomycetota bacterium]
MKNPHSRPVPVFIAILAIAIALPSAVAAVSSELWDAAENCACGLGDGLGALVDSGNRKVAKAANRTCAAIRTAREEADGQDVAGYLKALEKAAKRGRRALRVADRKGFETETLRCAFEDLRVATRRIIEAGIAEVKARPDFVTKDAVVRAVAKAERGLDFAREALAGKRPYVKSFAAYRQAWAALAKFL